MTPIILINCLGKICYVFRNSKALPEASEMPPILPGESNAFALSNASISRFCALSEESSIVLII